MLHVCYCTCSEVVRCHHFHKSMFFGDKKKASYVCSATLSDRLPLWSNAKHCAECPPLQNLAKEKFDPTAPFGLIDENAAVYFDFWSERNKGTPLYHEALRQSLHDVNGPFNKSCSVSRATNAFGLAGRLL